MCQEAVRTESGCDTDTLPATVLFGFTCPLFVVTSLQQVVQLAQQRDGAVQAVERERIRLEGLQRKVYVQLQ